MCSLENWSTQLWFFLIYENMLENIATSHNECKKKGKNMASYKTNNLLFFIWLTSLAMIENQFENRFKQVTIKFVKIHCVKQCLYSELLWSRFSCIWTWCGEIRSISQYSVRMRKNTDQGNSEYGRFLRNNYYSNI